jgi:predicted lipid carrier protein YhbT
MSYGIWTLFGQPISLTFAQSRGSVSIAVRVKALASDRGVKFAEDKTHELSVPADAPRHVDDPVARERVKLARQLHDEVASAIFATKLELDVASHLAAKHVAMETLRSALDDATDSANEAMAAIRQICAELKEFGSEDVDLFGDLMELLRAFERKTGAECLLSVRGDCSAFETRAATGMLRIIRRKLAEIASPPGVRRVQVDVLASQRHYGLKIRVHSVGELPVRGIAEGGFLPESAAKSSRPREGAAATAPGVARKSIFAVKIPRGFGPKAKRPPERQPSAAFLETQRRPEAAEL